MILNTILCLLLLGNLVLLILVYRAVKSQPKHIGQDDLDTLQAEVSKSGQEIRSEIRATQDSTTKTLVVNISELSKTLTTQLEGARTAFSESFQGLQQSNENKLDQIRQTVDEQLQTTLEKRLTESFNIVSERLEAVQHGLGTMQNLASEVGSLQRVLTNVSTRGAWGEVQLGAILEQILTSDQYSLNVQPHTGSERVEYAVRLPGNDDNPNTHIWLPIDSKFPTADYQRLVEATEIADKEAEKSATQSLIRRVRSEARDISEKYVSPPQTTDFAIMFLPTEGLNSKQHWKNDSQSLSTSSASVLRPFNMDLERCKILLRKWVVFNVS